MKFPANFSVAKRLYLVLAILVASLAGVANLSWLDLSRVSRLVAVTEDVRVPQLQRIAAIELNVIRVSLLIRHAMLVRSAQDLSTTVEEIISRRDLIKKSASDFRAGLSEDADLKSFEEFERLAGDFWPVADDNISLAKEGNTEAAFEMLVQGTVPARNRLLEWLGGAKKRQITALNRELETIRANADQTRLQLVGLVAAVAAGLTVFFLHIVSFIRRRVAAAQIIADRVSKGDLTLPIVNSGRDEFTPLVAALGAMQEGLVRIVTGVRQGTEAMLSASSQIAAGNQDLSSRTEQQAGSLQETVSSMEQLTSTVRQNANNAEQANELAITASEVAERGGSVVQHVVRMMGSIDESSNKIVEIVGVIEGIAFQTNILALNAAVEAARAGEQGRGFAVVATEVRGLAHRSSVAAKEIKELIDASVRQVELGARRATEAGTAMEDVVSGVLRVTGIISQITSASHEQATDIEHVNLAIAQLETTTQQNASLVEEAAAAAQSLQDQAGMLMGEVNAFMLEGQTQTTAARFRRANGIRQSATPQVR